MYFVGGVCVTVSKMATVCKYIGQQQNYWGGHQSSTMLIEEMQTLSLSLLNRSLVSERQNKVW